MAEVLLEVNGLRVDYDEVTAVDDVSFSVEAGMVYGLVGPNGAGKTSIIRVIATLLEPTYGTVHINGVSLAEDEREALMSVGYMPDFPPLYEDLTIYEFLQIFAGAYGIDRARRRPRIEQLIEMVQLTDKTNALAGSLSRGMRQRLFLAKTLLHDPQVLLLDEPASGLDPRARLHLRDIIVSLGKQGKAVVVSSHILAEMADFCNSVGIMERGKMVVSGRVEQILQQLAPERVITVKLLAQDDRLAPLLGEREGVSDLLVDGASFSFKMGGEPPVVAALLSDLMQNQFAVLDFHERERDLQDIFMKVSDGRGT